MSAADEELKRLEDAKRDLCAEFRRRMSRLLDREAIALGLTPHGNHEIDKLFDRYARMIEMARTAR